MILKSSVMTGTFEYGSSLARVASDGTANIVVGYSNLPEPSAGYVEAYNGPGSLVETPSGTVTHADPRFVDTQVTLENPTVDLRLRHDSPLIDRGEPGSGAGEDLAGETRERDGDDDDELRPDIGAYEYQREAPTAVIAAPAAGTFAAGAPLGFSAAGSGDPDAGDALTYGWSFGDGATGAGAENVHSYASGGPREVTLTVTDPTGLSATATRTLLVDGPPPPAPQPPAPQPPAPQPPVVGTGTGPGEGTVTAPADGTAPVVSAASLSRSRFRSGRGTRVRFALSEAADVRLTVQRRRHERWVTLGGFTRAKGAGEGSARFGKRLGGRALAPGRYRLRLVATDTAGNTSAPKRLRFRVMRSG